jgi:hypothetical protein
LEKDSYRFFGIAAVLFQPFFLTQRAQRIPEHFYYHPGCAYIFSPSQLLPWIPDCISLQKNHPMKNPIRLFSRFTLPALFIIILISGCHNEKPAEQSAENKVIVYAEFMHEVNSFSPVVTTRRDFMAEHLVFGEEVRASAVKEKKQLAGFLKAVEKAGRGSIETVPLVHAKSMSGGPVDSAFYRQIKTTILDGIAAQAKIDGVYLSMHGAMGVQGMFDPEGDIIEAVRELVGHEVPIAVSFDLHANVTRRRAECANIIIGYKTNPHRDHFKTGYRSGHLLIRTMRGEVDPVMVVNKMPLLKGGGINIDIAASLPENFPHHEKDGAR